MNKTTLTIEDAQREAANIQKLPPRCYVFIDGNPPGRRIAIVAVGETGYYPYDQADGDAQTPLSLIKHVVLEQNEKLGVTPAQMQAMFLGSMCGFHAPGADPGSETNVRLGEAFVAEASTWQTDLAARVAAEARAKLEAYVGRSFVLQNTKYGALDGLTGKVTAVQSTLGLDGDVDMLAVDVPASDDFKHALMLPDQFASEVLYADFPDVVRNPATGLDVYRITAERFWRESTTGPAPWVDSRSESYLLDPERLEGMEAGYSNALREIWDIGRVLDNDGRVMIVTSGPDTFLAPDHPVYVGAR